LTVEIGSLHADHPSAGMATKRAENNVTVPAPGSALESARPTSVPDYDLGAVAAGVMPDAKVTALPIDLCVPVRRRGVSLEGTPHRAAFLLSHVDDRSTVGDIAMSAQLPLAEAIATFEMLADAGIVELRGVSRTDPSRGEASKTKSGLRSKS
jgi:hypothetical protein